MRKVSEKCRRALSAILAAAMVLTSAPGTTMPVLAAEQTAAVTEVSDADEMMAETAAEDSADDADKDAAAQSGADAADKSAAGAADKENADQSAADDTNANKGGAEKEAADEGDPSEGEDTTVAAPAIEMYSNETAVQSGDTVPNSATVDVTFTAEEGATVKYTTNGDDPAENGTEGTSTTVSTSNTAGETVTIKAVAVKDDQTSEVTTATVVFNDVPTALAAPTFTLNPTDGNSANRTDAKFQLSSTDTDGVYEICYYISDTELDGDIAKTIDESGSVYTSEVTVASPDQDEAATRTVYAMAVPKEDPTGEYTGSEVVSAVFSFAAKQAAAPEAPVIVMKDSENTAVADGASVANDEVVTVTMTAAEGIEIYYTDNGETPTSASAKYTDAISLSTSESEGETKTIKAIAYDADAGLSSEAATATVTFGAAEPETEGVKVLFYGDTALTDIVVENSDKEEITGEAGEEAGQWFVLAEEDENLSITIKAKSGCTLNSVKTGVGEAVNTTQKVKNNASSFTLKAAENTKVSVGASENITGFTVTDDASETGLTPVGNTGNTYNVASRNTYTITGTMGADNHEISFDGVQLKEGNKLVASDTSSAVISEDAKSIKLTIGADLAGKNKVTVIATVGETNSTLTFNVAKILTEVTVQGVKGDILSQEIGKHNEYNLTLNPKNAQDEIGVVYCSSIEGDDEGAQEEGADCVESIEIRDGKLLVETTKETGIATVILYNKTSVKARKGEVQASDPKSFEDKEILGSFFLHVTKPAWAGKNPTVKLAQATDKKLYLAFTSPADMYGRYYEVKWEQKDGVSENSTGSTGVKYFGPVHGDPADYFIQVFDDETAGRAAKFDVTTRIVWMKDDETPSAENPATDENTICMSNWSNTVVMSTKDPYYADKITLKKGKTTIYSGQQDVQAATIDFGKNTSYIEGATAEVIDGSEAFDGSEGVTAAVYGTNTVKVSAGKYTIPGKYTVRVTAMAADGVKAATADLVITVVAGLNDFDAYSDTESIYLAPNKAGSASIKIDYGDDVYDDYNFAYKPKTSKFTYTVGVGRGKAFVEKANVLTYTDKKGTVKNAVTVKNGKVTVDKNYVLEDEGEGPDANTFTVRVAAADYAGNTTARYVSFTVTREAQKLGKLVLVGYDGEGKRVIIPDEDGVIDKITMGELQGAWVIVVNEDAEVNETTGLYDAADEINDAYYKLSVKGKGISIIDDGYLLPSKPGKNITLTATATDGSKNSVSLKINQMTYDTVSAEEAGVVLNSGEAMLLKNSSVSSNDISVSPADMFALYATADADKKDSVMNIAGISTDLSLKIVSGLKVVVEGSDVMPQYYAKNQVMYVVMTGKTAVVKLMQGKKELGTYTLTNTQLASDAITPKIKATKEKLLVGKEDQTLTFEVDANSKKKLPEDAKVNLNVTDRKSGTYFEDVLIVRDGIRYEDGKITVPFADVDIAGSGTLYFSFTYKEDGVTKSTNLSNCVKISSAAMKKSFALTTNKYKMSLVDVADVEMQYKGSNVQDVYITGLKNANTKGNATKFTTYLATTWYESMELELSDDGIARYDEIAGTNLEGYVCGTVTYEDGTTQKFETKVTVSFAKDGKAVNNYKASKLTLAGTISENALTDSKITVKAGKNEAWFGDVKEQVQIKNGKKYVDTDLYTAHVNYSGDLQLNLEKAYEKWEAEGRKSDLNADLQLQVAYGTGGWLWNGEEYCWDYQAYVPLTVKVTIKKNAVAERTETAQLTAPVIAVSLSGNDISDEDGVINLNNRQGDVTFTLTAGDAEETYEAIVYTLDGEDPATCEHVQTYSDAVTLTAPDQDTEGTIVIKAMTKAEAESGCTDSQAATVTVVYGAKSAEEPGTSD